MGQEVYGEMKLETGNSKLEDHHNDGSDTELSLKEREFFPEH